MSTLNYNQEFERFLSDSSNKLKYLVELNPLLDKMKIVDASIESENVKVITDENGKGISPQVLELPTKHIVLDAEGRYLTLSLFTAVESIKNETVTYYETLAFQGYRQSAYSVIFEWSFDVEDLADFLEVEAETAKLFWEVFNDEFSAFEVFFPKELI